MKNKLERITYFSPAYDKRDPNPSKNYGIGCVKCFMVLKGKEGAVHFIFGTGMHLESTVQEYAAKGKMQPTFMAGAGRFFTPFEAMGYDVGYHAHVPQWDGQTSRENCEWLDGKACFGDGSALRAEQWMSIFLEKGSEEIWKMLEEDYKNRFLTEKNEKPGA